MSREETALAVLKPMLDRLKADWATQAVMGSLDEAGDQQRRLAAIKTNVADELLIQLERAIKG